MASMSHQENFTSPEGAPAFHEARTVPVLMSRSPSRGPGDAFSAVRRGVMRGGLRGVMHGGLGGVLRGVLRDVLCGVLRGVAAAVPVAVAMPVAVVVVVAGCATLVPPADLHDGGDVPVTAAARVVDQEPSLAVDPQEIPELLVSATAPAGEPVALHGAMVYTLTTAGTVLALVEQHGALAALRMPAHPRESPGAVTTVELGSNCLVEDFRAVNLMEGATNGFAATIRCDGIEQTLVVLEAGTPRAYVLMVPLSPVSRLTIRDLTGDGVEEVLRASLVFEADGRREILLEAFRWDGRDLVLLGSTPLLRRVNGALERLERQLLNATLEDAAGASPLTPLEGAPPYSSIPPDNRTVVVPRLMELPVSIAAEHGELAHELAINGNLYRVVIDVQFNPLATNPVSVRRLE